MFTASVCPVPVPRSFAETNEGTLERSGASIWGLAASAAAERRVRAFGPELAEVRVRPEVFSIPRAVGEPDSPQCEAEAALAEVRDRR